MMTGTRPPSYFRARIDVFRDEIALAGSGDADIALLRNGVMRDKAREEELIQAKLQQQEYPDTPLVLSELCCFNTWFAMHPEKICGDEVITTSREFPLSVKGDQSWIENTINHAIGEDRLLLPVPFEWTLKYSDSTDPDFDVEYTNGTYTARIYQGGVHFNLTIYQDETVLENTTYTDLAPANIRLMEFMKEHRGKQASKSLELEALALELELQITEL